MIQALRLLTLTVPSFLAHAGNLVVTKTADSSGICNSGMDCSLREAINAANDEANYPGPDFIGFGANVKGTILLATALPAIQTDIYLKGPGAHLLAVTRTSGKFRIFLVDNGTTSGPTVTISGLTVSNGHTDGDNAPFPNGLGGGILNLRSTLTVNNCIISDNIAGSLSGAYGVAQGGGICNAAGVLTITNCTVTNNSSGFGGGIMSTPGGQLVVMRTTVADNRAASVGGINFNGGGGGINNHGGTATISDCLVADNLADYGGGIENFASALSSPATMTMRNCTLSDNLAESGGGIYNHEHENTATLVVSHCTLSNNRAGYNGDCIFNAGGDAGVFGPWDQRSVTAPSILDHILRVQTEGALVRLDNNILQGYGSNLCDYNLDASTTSGGYNLSNDLGGNWYTGVTFLTAVGDRIHTDSRVGPLQDNGGPTATRALLPGSPARDKGKSFGLANDQRGYPRPIDVAALANASGGDGSDIGAFETPAAAHPTKSDFNGDEGTDILWQSTSGPRSIWLMNGPIYAGSVSLGKVAIAWSIVGSGDFNADGKVDIIWQNSISGQRATWFMNGTGFGSSVSLGTVSTAWNIRGSGDFNGDGKSDLLWQNSANGQRAIWLMNGTVRIGDISLGNVPLNWDIAGSGDFNGDAKSDILWQNKQTGKRTLWLMNGTARSGEATLATIPTVWGIAGVGDFNGDGKSDLLWQNSDTGQRSIWLMDGTTRSAGVSLGNIAPSWSMQNY